MRTARTCLWAQGCRVSSPASRHLWWPRRQGRPTPTDDTRSSSLATGPELLTGVSCLYFHCSVPLSIKGPGKGMWYLLRSPCLVWSWGACLNHSSGDLWGAAGSCPVSSPFPSAHLLPQKFSGLWQEWGREAQEQSVDNHVDSSLCEQSSEF